MSGFVLLLAAVPAPEHFLGPLTLLPVGLQHYFFEQEPGSQRFPSTHHIPHQVTEMPLTSMQAFPLQSDGFALVWRNHF